MTSDHIERFNRTAEGYLRWWAPVLTPGSNRLLDRLEGLDPGLRGGAPRKVLDVGCGTGNATLEAARRWPGATLVGLDGSRGMLEVAGRLASRLDPEVSRRISFVLADAAALPLEDRFVDLVTCAYVLQQIPDRRAALREMFRVLRPGGTVAIVGWTREKIPFAAEVELEAALAECGIVRPVRRHSSAGHFASDRAAANEVRKAGFERVSSRPDALNEPWTAADFVTYRETTRDQDLFDSLDGPVRTRLHGVLRRRLEGLSADELVYRPPIVSIVGRRPLESGAREDRAEG